jgi:ABC-type sugar transport system substrate-binding protein
MAFVFYRNFKINELRTHTLKLRLSALGVLLLSSFLLSGCPRPPSLPKKAPPLPKGQLPTITVIAGGSESYWNEARRGAEAAGKKLNAKIIWKAPSGKDKDALLKSQQKLMTDAIETSQGVVAAPIDSTQMMRFFREVALAGFPVVAFDRDVYTIQNKLTYVHNDEEKSEALNADLQSGKSVGIIEPDYYQMGYQSVKAILDYRAVKDVPREIKIAPRLITKESIKTSTLSKAKTN